MCLSFQTGMLHETALENVTGENEDNSSVGVSVRVRMSEQIPSDAFKENDGVDVPLFLLYKTLATCLWFKFCKD